MNNPTPSSSSNNSNSKPPLPPASPQASSTSSTAATSTRSSIFRRLSRSSTRKLESKNDANDDSSATKANGNAPISSNHPSGVPKVPERAKEGENREAAASTVNDQSSSLNNSQQQNGSGRRPSLLQTLGRKMSGSLSGIVSAGLDVASSALGRRKSSLSQRTAYQVIQQGGESINVISTVLPSSYKTVLFSWGRSEEGQLLVENSQGDQVNDQLDKNENGDEGGKENVHKSKPKKSEFLERRYRITDVAGNFYHSLALTDGGQVVGSGENAEGQLQPGRQQNFFSNKPRLLEMLLEKQVASVSCGLNHTAIVTYEGDVLTFGQNEFNQLGHSTNANVKTSVPPRILDGPIRREKAVKVACAENTTFILTRKGEVFSCGSSARGIAGLGNEDDVPIAKKLGGNIGGVPIVHIASGPNHAIALSATGRVFAWGDNRYGQCGILPVVVDKNGDNVANSRYLLSPTFVPMFYPLAQDNANQLQEVLVVHASCGGKHSGFITTKGKLFMCGKNDNGQLGIETETVNLGDPINGYLIVAPPVQIIGLDGFVLDVACGDSQTVVLLEGGKLVSFDSKEKDATNNKEQGSSSSHSESNEAKSIVPQSRAQIIGGEIENEKGIFMVSSGGESFFALAIQNGSSHAGKVLAETLRKRGPLILSRIRPDIIEASAKDASKNGDMSKLNALLLEEGFFDVGSLNASFLLESFVQSEASMMNYNKTKSGIDLEVLDRTLQWILRALLTIKPASAAASRTRASTSISSDATNGFGINNTPSGVSATTTANTPASTSKEINLQWLNDHYKPFFEGPLMQLASSINQAARKILETHIKQQLAAGKTIRNIDFSLPETAETIVVSDQLRCFFILLFSPLNDALRDSTLVNLAQCISALPPQAKSVLAYWIRSDLSGDRFRHRLVRPFLVALDKKIAAHDWNTGAVFLCNVLEFFYNVNNNDQKSKTSNISKTEDIDESHTTLIPNEQFYAQQPTRWGDQEIFAEYSRWRSMTEYFRKLPEQAVQKPFSIFNYPFLFDPQLKLILMKIEQYYALYSIETNSLNDNPLYEMVIRRNCIVGDSLYRLSLATTTELRSYLKVKFKDEEGEDGGGVKREYFELVSLELFTPEYGMFQTNKETGKLWFNKLGKEFLLLESAGNGKKDDESPAVTARKHHDYEEAKRSFKLVGTLLGLCIYNITQLDVQFPKVFYRKLLGRYQKLNPNDVEANLNELLDIDPEFTKGLRELYQYENDDMEDVFGLYFEASVDVCGIKRSHELIPKGSSTPVNQKNKDQYICAYANYVINESIEPMMSLIEEGFNRVVDVSGPALSLFSSDELEVMLIGTSKLDFEALRKNTSYEGGYYENHPAMQMFWDVVSKFDYNQKKEFLRFVSGCPRAPVGGLGGNAIAFKIHRAGPDSDQLPTVATCHTLLLLPDYSSKEKMEQKLLLSLQFNSGFGLM